MLGYLSRSVAFVFILAVSVGSSSGALVFTIGNGEIITGSETRNPFESVIQGQGGAIRFSVAASGESFTLDGYNIRIEVSPESVSGDGFGQPLGITFTNATFVPGGFGGSPNLDFDEAAFNNLFSGGNGNFDLTVNETPSSGLLLNDGVSTDILNLNFTTTAATAPGVYDVRFVATPILVTEDQFQTAPNSRTLQAFSGSFEVTAIPEPSSMLAIGSFVVVVGLVRRRRTRMSVAATQA